jgi:hypothetical protein
MNDESKHGKMRIERKVKGKARVEGEVEVEVSRLTRWTKTKVNCPHRPKLRGQP